MIKNIRETISFVTLTGYKMQQKAAIKHKKLCIFTKLAINYCISAKNMIKYKYFS